MCHIFLRHSAATVPIWPNTMSSRPNGVITSTTNLPPNFSVQTRKGQGIDLLSDGCYVVARPSTINGHTYKLIRGGQPKLLTLDDIRRIKAFLENQATPVASSTPKRRITACQGQVETLQDVSSDLYTPVITSADLLVIYQRYVHQVGRNRGTIP